MNRIQAKIIDIFKHHNIASIKLEAFKSIFNVVVLDFNNIDFKKNQFYFLNFKESEVILSFKNAYISTQNRFVATIIALESDDIFTRISLNFHQQIITSLITKDAQNALNFQINQQCAWFIQPNDIILSKN